MKSNKPGILFGLCDLKRKGKISKILLPGIDVWLIKMTPSVKKRKTMNF